MLHNTHVNSTLALVGCGLLSYHAANPNFNTPAIDVPVIVGSFIGASIPDIDSPSSYITKKLGHFGKTISKILNHRGWTHSIWFILLYFGIYYLSLNNSDASTVYNTPQGPISLLLLGVAIGNLLHILEDNCSRQGILFFYPFTHYQKTKNGHPYKKRHWSNFRYQTGGTAEHYINFVAIIADFYILIQLFMLWAK